MIIPVMPDRNRLVRVGPKSEGIATGTKIYSELGHYSTAATQGFRHTTRRWVAFCLFSVLVCGIVLGSRDFPPFSLSAPTCGGDLRESFEEAEIPYDWTIYDGDEDGHTWQVVYLGANAAEGEYGVVAPGYGYTPPSDDWLMTPRLTVGERDSLVLWARSADQESLADYQVWVSTYENTVESFTTLLDTVKQVPDEWTQYSFPLDPFRGDSIYIAIRYVSSVGRIFLDYVSGPDIWMAPHPVIFLSRDSLSLLGVSISKGVSIDLGVTNVGGETLEIEEMSTDNSVFDGTISAESIETCSTETITVTFLPESSGTETANLVISSNAPTSPDTVFLWGNGVEPLSFFPHEVGNIWQYWDQTVGDVTLRLTKDSVGADGSTFLFYAYDKKPLYRVDPHYRVYKHPSSVNSVDYILDADSGDVWLYDEDQPLYAWVATLDTGLVFWNQTTFSTIKVMRYGPSHPDSVDEDDLIWYFERRLATGLGLIYEWEEPGIITYLKGCVVSGDTFGILLDLDQSTELVPTGFTLHSIYPNPFNSRTNVKFILGTQRHISISMYDILGRRVKNVFADRMLPGIHYAEIDGSSLHSGIYFIQLRSGNQIITRKVILLK